jgi:hypothetical protein
MGPCQADFGGVYNNVDVFYKIAECLGLGQGADGFKGQKATSDVSELRSKSVAVAVGTAVVAVLMFTM